MKHNQPDEKAEVFVSRKQDHIRLALDQRTQALGSSGFDFIELEHEALPDFDFSEINTKTNLLEKTVDSPVFISSMTAGHEQGTVINERLASLADQKKILFAVGSQRRELVDPNQSVEWIKLKEKFPNLNLIANLGIAQVIQSSPQEISSLVKRMGAVGLFVHLNPLQELIQSEGTPYFRGGIEALARLKEVLSVPLLVKEVGCGISNRTVRKLEQAGVDIVDVSGRGGTHWGRLEGLRDQTSLQQKRASEVYANWGFPTAVNLRNVLSEKRSAKIWASGGIRNGLEVAKCLALGAQAVGCAAPFLKGAVESSESLEMVYEQLIFELKIAMFCTGIRQVADFKEKKVWI